MRKFGLGVMFIGLLASCQPNSEGGSGGFKNAFPLTSNFLAHEWKVDSVGSNSELAGDIVFFTPDNKFWHCSYNNATYIIDSCLEVKEGGVYENGALKYTIYSLDSSKIALVSPKNEVIQAKMNGDFSENYLKSIVALNPIKKFLNGSWELVSSEYAPTKFPSFCGNIDKGAKLVFEPKGTMKIFQKDSTNNCGTYNYKLWEDEIHFAEGDMVMTMKIGEIDANRLEVIANFIRDEDQSEEAIKLIRSGYKMEFSKK